MVYHSIALPDHDGEIAHRKLGRIGYGYVDIEVEGQYYPELKVFDYGSAGLSFFWLQEDFVLYDRPGYKLSEHEVAQIKRIAERGIASASWLNDDIQTEASNTFHEHQEVLSHFYRTGEWI